MKQSVIALIIGVLLPAGARGTQPAGAEKQLKNPSVYSFSKAVNLATSVATEGGNNRKGSPRPSVVDSQQLAATRLRPDATRRKSEKPEREQNQRDSTRRERAQET